MPSTQLEPMVETPLKTTGQALSGLSWGRTLGWALLLGPLLLVLVAVLCGAFPGLYLVLHGGL